LVILRRKLSGVNPQLLERFLARARKAVRLRGEVHVLVTGNAEMLRLNRSFRLQNRPTDVLSFPAVMNGAAGDIAISATMAAANARRLGHSTSDEIKVLMLHGLLHLAGYDHETDTGRMARREARLRRSLRLPSALTGRSAAPGHAS